MGNGVNVQQVDSLNRFNVNNYGAGIYQTSTGYVATNGSAIYYGSSADDVTNYYNRNFAPKQTITPQNVIRFNNMSQSELQAFIGNNTNSKAARDAAQQVLNQRFPQVSVANSAIYPTANGQDYAKMLEQNKGQSWWGQRPSVLESQTYTTAGQTAAQSAGQSVASNVQQAAKKTAYYFTEGDYRYVVEDGKVVGKFGKKDQAFKKLLAELKGKGYNIEGKNVPINPSGTTTSGVKAITGKTSAEAGQKLLVNKNAVKGGFKWGKALKKAGKWGLIAAGVIGAACLLFKGCSDKKEVAPVKEETQPTTPVEPTPVEPVQPTPVEPVQPTPVDPTPVEPTPVTPVPPESLNDDGTYTVQKKESPYSIAEKLLKEYCQANGIDKNITGYSPEVAKLAQKLGELNNLEFETISEAAAAGRDATKRMPKPMVHPGDIWNIPDLSEYVKKEEEIKTGENLNLAA